MRLVCGFAIALVALGASGVEYFPAGSLDEKPSRHQFLADWYSGHLAALQEPSIWQISSRNQQRRCTDSCISGLSITQFAFV
jgi:hypothetical protein